MADDQVPEQIMDAVEEQATGTKPTREPAYTPVYKVIGDDKIPVSKQFGTLFKQRRDFAIDRMKHNGILEAADEAIKYYRNDQLGHRDTTTSADVSGNRRASRKLNETHSETENIVYASINAIKPAIYSKNPTVTCTTDIEEQRALCSAVEKLVNTLIARKKAPGLNLKPKARKGIVLGMLHNCAYMRVDWVFKDNSLEGTQEELAKIEEEYAKAKTPREVQEAEGKLMALAETVDALDPSGPLLRLMSLYQVVVDPDSSMPDGSDANWMMYCDYLPCYFVYAKYCTEGDKGDFKSIYKPTHVLGGKKQDDDMIVNNFKLIKDNEPHTAYGFDDEPSFRRGQYMKVWYVWDKPTRRVYMYHDDDWSHPIWVWNDPYKLDTFFNLFKLQFHDDPLENHAKGEITYILDQQDAINEINDEGNRWRKSARRNIAYNSTMLTRDQALEIIKGATQELIGIPLPEGAKIGDAVMSLVPPSINFAEIFNKQDKMESIDRILGTNDVLRGAQFKTNTTNKAIENYNATTALRIDEKIDALEDWLTSITWAVAQMCMRFMDQATVDKLIGIQKGDQAVAWNFNDDDIYTRYNFRLVAGSTQKPTSAVKKQEALQMGQVLGQFAKMSPQVIVLLLKVWEQAFDEIVLDDDDWVALRQSVMAAIGGAGAPAGPGGSPASGAGGAGGGPEQLIMAAKIVDGLPPEIKKAVAQALVQGQPLTPIAQRLVERAMAQQQAQGNPQQQQPNQQPVARQ